MSKQQKVARFSSTPFGLSQDYSPAAIVSNRAPTTLDIGYPLGQAWVNESTGIEYHLTKIAAGSATWNVAAAVGGDLNTLTGDAGGAISATANNINLLGTANQIATTGAGSTITYSLPSAVTAPGSITSTTSITSGTTMTAGTGLTVTAGGAAISGNSTINGGTVGLGTDNAANAISIGVGTTARAVHIADSAAAHVVTIGSTTGAASLTEKVGTGNYSLDGAASSTYAVGASTTTGTITIGGTAQTGDIVLGSSTGANAVKIANGSGAGTVSIAAVQTGGAVNVGTAMTTGTMQLGGTGAHTGTITLAPGTGAQTVQIAHSTGVKTVQIADGAAANLVTLGSTTGAAATTIQAGTGGLALSAGGAVSMAPVTGSAASANITLNGRVGQSTHTGLTTASGASQVFVITNSAVTSTTQAIQLSADNVGSNDAQMTVTRVLLAVGSITVTLKNNGAAALNGDVHINWWILN